MSTFRYRCRSCNSDLGAAGETVESHLATYPSHSIHSLLYDNSQTVATIEGVARIHNNRLFYYDSVRAKWLSNDRLKVEYAIPTTNQRNIYMRLWGYMIPSTSAMGFPIMYNATITKLVASCSLAISGDVVFGIRNYGGASMASVTLLRTNTVVSDLTVNVDVDAGARLCCYMTNSVRLSYPQLIVEYAWRI